MCGDLPELVFIRTLRTLPLTHPESSDYQGGPYSVTFPPGSTSATVNITIIDDNVYEKPDPENFTATISTLNTGVASISAGADDTATISIFDDEGAQSSAIASSYVACVYSM